MPQQTIDQINSLNQELLKLMQEYQETLERDEVFEIRKAIRMKIKEIQKQLDHIVKLSEQENSK